MTTVQMNSMPALSRGAASLAEWVHIPTPGDHYSPKTGSAVITVIREMNRCHLAAGGRARVLVAKGTWDGYDDGVRFEVPFRRLGTPPRAIKAFDRFIGGMAARRPLSGLPYADAADVLGHSFDGVVFVHNEPSGVEVLARRCPNAKVCLWVQNELFRTYTQRQARRVVDHAHRVVCCSSFIGCKLAQITGENPKIVTVLNGVDTEKFVPSNPRPNSEPPIILFLGRMLPEKSPDLLVKAAVELKARGIGFRLRLVGSRNFNAADAPTPFERQIHDMAGQLGDMISFAPFQPRHEVVREFQSSDIFCLPSDWDDPCPLALFEAMASGLPVVASRRGGIPEIGRDAVLLFTPPDAEELAHHLGSFCADVALRVAMGRKARARAMETSWSVQYQRLKEVI